MKEKNIVVFNSVPAMKTNDLIDKVNALKHMHSNKVVDKFQFYSKKTNLKEHFILKLFRRLRSH